MHPIRLIPLLALLTAMLLGSLTISISGLAYALKQSQGFIQWGGGLADVLKMVSRATLTQQAIYIFSVVALIPIAFFFIPASLQRIKVRPIHIARIAIYSIIGAITAVLVVAAVQSVWEFATGAPAPRAIRPSDWRIPWAPASAGGMVFVDTVRPVWIITILWSWWWWRAACRDYLRLPDATLTTTMLMIIVVLASYLVQHAVDVFKQLV